MKNYNTSQEKSLEFEQSLKNLTSSHLSKLYVRQMVEKKYGRII